jgi:pyruvate/2-oxoglutarate/acetoin dehydrogenase E1 component
MSYKGEVIKAMNYLARDERTIFIGQGVLYPGLIYETLEGIPNIQRLEVPVFEDTQLGMCTGLALEGFIPICIFPRIDFLICAMNQLVNHLDKISEMSNGYFSPKVIIRTMIGSRTPLDPGLQHSSDYTLALTQILKSVNVERLTDQIEIVPAYIEALRSNRSKVLIESMERIKLG